jgi:hypothetical protein
MAGYARDYGDRREPGWTGGGQYPGPGYRTEGYGIRRRERTPRYDRVLILRPGRGYDRGYGRSFRPYGRGVPPYDPQARGLAPARYAADYHGGGYGPSHYSGGFYGRELGRGR